MREQVKIWRPRKELLMTKERVPLEQSLRLRKNAFSWHCGRAWLVGKDGVELSQFRGRGDEADSDRAWIPRVLEKLAIDRS